MYLTIWQGHAIVTKTLEYTGRSTTKVKNIMTEEMQNIVEPVIQSDLEVTEAVALMEKLDQEILLNMDGGAATSFIIG